MTGLVIALDPTDDILTQGLTQAGYQILNYHQASIHDIPEWPQAVGVLVRGRVMIEAEHLRTGTQLQWIGRLGSGMENIDTHTAAQQGIACYSAPEGNRIALGEHMVGMLLALQHKIHQGFDRVRQGHWEREAHTGFELFDSTVGILGFGHMGSAFAERLQGFGCRILAYDKYKRDYAPHYVEAVDLDTLRRESDVISIHLPLTEETDGLVNRDYLSPCVQQPVVLNSSRGGVLNTQEAFDMLEKGELRGLGLDVIELERRNLHGLSDRPAWFSALLEHPQVIVTPHVAGWSEQSFPRMARVLLAKILS